MFGVGSAHTSGSALRAATIFRDSVILDGGVSLTRVGRKGAGSLQVSHATHAARALK